MEYIEIILNNVQTRFLKEIITEQLQFMGSDVRASHFFSPKTERTITYSEINNWDMFFEEKGTGDISLKEVVLGMSIKNVVVLITYRPFCNDISISFGEDQLSLWLCDAMMEYGVLIGAFFSAWFLHLTLQPLDLMIHDKKYGVSHYLRQMDNFTIFGSNKRKLRKLLDDMNAWLAVVGLKLKETWQVFRVGFTPQVEKAHEALPEKKQRHRRPRMPSALGYRFGHGYTILRKHNLFRLKQGLHTYYYRRDRNRVISFKRASGLISRLGQLRKCNSQKILERYYQPKTMFDLKKVVRRECRRLQLLYPSYVAA